MRRRQNVRHIIAILSKARQIIQVSCRLARHLEDLHTDVHRILVLHLVEILDMNLRHFVQLILRDWSVQVLLGCAVADYLTFLDDSLSVA